MKICIQILSSVKYVFIVVMISQQGLIDNKEKLTTCPVWSLINHIVFFFLVPFI